MLKLDAHHKQKPRFQSWGECYENEVELAFGHWAVLYYEVVRVEKIESVND